MTSFFRCLAGLIVVVLLFGVGGEAARAEFKGLSTQHTLFGEPTVGNTSIVVRTVTGTISNNIRELRFEDDIYHNEIIETFEESATEITFIDASTLSLGPKTRITLDRFVFDPNPDNSSFIMTVTEGALRFSSGVLPSEAYQINTPVATIGIRGTLIDVMVERATGLDGAPITNVDLTVLQGEAALISCRGETIKVPEGHSSTVQASPDNCL